MKIVVHSKKEEKLLLLLMDFLSKQNFDFFLKLEDPLSFQLEQLFDELTDCLIEIDKSEEPLGLT
ncbi:MAG: hypothetical protein ACTSSG_01315 [Candidatus Heimdallarchaeaceae archaeon]